MNKLEIYMTINVVIGSFWCELRNRPGNEPFQLIGIFSDCSGNRNHNMSGFENTTQHKEFLQNSKVCRKSMDWVVENKEFVANSTEAYHRMMKSDYFRHKRRWSMNDVEYLSYAVCSQEDAMWLAAEILLNPVFYVTDRYQKSPLWKSIHISSYSWTTKILAMALYTEESVTIPLLLALDISTFPIYHLSYEFKRPESFDYDKTKVFDSKTPYEYDYGRIVETLQRKLVFRFVVVLLGPRSVFYEYFLRKLQQTNEFCYSVEEIDIRGNLTSGVQDLFSKLSSPVNYYQYILLFGKGMVKIQVFNMAIQAGLSNFTWFIYNIESVYLDIQYIPETTHILTLFSLRNNDLYHLEFLRPNKVVIDYVKAGIELSLLSDAKIAETLGLCRKKMERFYTGFMRSFDLYELRVYYPVDLQEYLARFKLYNDRITRRKAMLMLKMTTKIGDIMIYRTFDFLKSKASNALCRKPVCPTGWRNLYGPVKLPEHKRPWSQSTGWSCQKCPKYFYKPIAGDGECRRCGVPMVSTPLRNACYDPYKTMYNNLQGKICVILAITGFSLASIILVIFIVHRNTSLVRSSDYRTTCCHFVLLLFAFVAYPTVFLQKPSVVVCTVRPFVVSILNCSCVAIMFIKCNHVIAIICSKLRVSRERMRKLRNLHLFMIFLFNAFGVCISYVLIQQNPPRVEQALRVDVSVRYLSCSNSEHVNIQIYYLLLLQFLPAVQAFRGRNLPGPFNEAMCIVYTTFTTIIAYSVMVPIYYFQQFDFSKATVQCYILVVTNLVQLVILYGKKTFVILFRPHKNTRKYVRSQMQNKTLQELSSIKV